MTEEKKIKVVFDPAFFEAFEGSQEELDELMGEINSMFDGKSAEDIKAMGQPVDWNDMNEEEAEVLMQALHRAKNDIKPTLQ
jgi:hypothetical protein